jgi:CorA-like Mg2+ transporter protein
VAARNTTQLSIDIANIARRDNATMKALAFIGVLYLPGTFISGIFGSNFVNYSPSNGPDWQLSDKFWIYWVITIPVTVFTVLLWVVLDDTIEMYGSLIGRTRAAWRNIWNQLPISKQPKKDTRREMNPYPPGGVNGAIV